jgi:D-glycero-D-manno-heptose 1,7-bisphosphate phosphatase
MKAVFLDRDGVINELIYHQEQGIIDSPFNADQLRLLPGVGEAIRNLREMRYKVILVSNQPGVAKGHMSWETFEEIREKMKEELAKEQAYIDKEYYCFHHPEAKINKLRVNCECRKPKPGMLLQAAREIGVDLFQSWLIGDSITDIKAGKDAGCRTILLGRVKCELCRLMDDNNARPDLICSNPMEASRMIVTEAYVAQQPGDLLCKEI